MTTDNQEPKKVIPIQAVPADESEEMVSLYAAAKKIYPRSVEGIFAYWRWITVAITQIVFYGLPWVEWGTRQAVLFDLEARRFYIFGLVLYPQDFIYLTGLLLCHFSCSPQWRGVCGVAMRARKRCIAKFSCGSSERSKEIVLLACVWMMLIFR
jgi:hypothetical protein